MISKISKKALLTLSLVTGLCVHAMAGSGPQLQDVNYQFDKQKLKVAADSFHFLRSFVDYYYLLIKANKASLSTLNTTWNFPGWCVGDAHAENFGTVLLNNGTPVFTMNDIDDSGPCPVVLDIMRLMVSSRLYDDNTKIDKILEAYLAGVQAQKFDMPNAVKDMMKKSQKNGFAPSDNKVKNNKIIRDPNMNEVTPDESAQVKQALIYLRPYMDPHTQVLDMVSTAKVGGGSGGLLRYEVLLSNNGQLLHLELKEEVTPSIYPVAVTQIPATKDRVMATLKLDQGAGLSNYYNVVQIGNKSMMVRPRFDGNIGVSLDDNSGSDNKDIIRYEAYQLGAIHSRSVRNISGWVQALNAVPQNTWESDVEALTKLFNAKYKQLK